MEEFWQINISSEDCPHLNHPQAADEPFFCQLIGRGWHTECNEGDCPKSCNQVNSPDAEDCDECLYHKTRNDFYCSLCGKQLRR